LTHQSGQADRSDQLGVLNTQSDGDNSPAASSTADASVSTHHDSTLRVGQSNAAERPHHDASSRVPSALIEEAQDVTDRPDSVRHYDRRSEADKDTNALARHLRFPEVPVNVADPSAPDNQHSHNNQSGTSVQWVRNKPDTTTLYSVSKETGSPRPSDARPLWLR
jgi:hypothetical protein